MPRIILLSDVSVNNTLEYTRYVGPYALATHLEADGFDVVVIDKFTRHPNPLEYLENFVNEDTVFIGISSTLIGAGSVEMRNGRAESGTGYLNSYLWFHAAEELRDWTSRLKAILARKKSPAKLVLGGAKATVLYIRDDHDGTIAAGYGDFDFVLLGIADLSVVALARALRDGSPLPTKRKNGLEFVLDTKYFEYKDCPTTVFLPKHAVSRGEGLPLEVARGCIYNCRFCYYDKKESRRKPLDRLREEMIRNYELYRTNAYHFCDDCFNDSPRKVNEVCNEILRLPFKVEWVSYARADMAVKFPETLDLMVESGARGLWFGLESFNPESAKSAGKGIHPERVKEFMLSSYAKHSARCLFQASFIIGLPHETVESQWATVDWLDRNHCLDLIDWGALTVGHYNAEIDKTVIDMSEYARNPSTYGIRKLEFPRWEHATMNYDQATEILREVTRKFREKRKTYMTSIWQYPSLRSLGYTWDEIAPMARNSGGLAETEMTEADSRRMAWMEAYWNRLLHENRAP